MTEEVSSAPVGPMLMVAMVDPSAGAEPSRSLIRPDDDPLMWEGNWLHLARRLDLSDSVFTLDDSAEEKD